MDKNIESLKKGGSSLRTFLTLCFVFGVFFSTFTYGTEVDVTTFDEFKEAITSGDDIINITSGFIIDEPINITQDTTINGNNNTIKIKPLNSTSQINTNAGLYINDINIDGMNAEVQYTTPMFYIQPNGDVKINNSTIYGRNNGTYEMTIPGMLFYVDINGSLEIDGSTIKDCQGTRYLTYGTLIYIAGGNATIKNSTFLNNNIGGIGLGIIAVYDDNSRNTRGNLLIDNSQFTNNESVYGGVIVGYHSNIDIINNTSFKNNSSYYGGAIYTEGVNLTLRDSSLYNNTSNRGGAIYFEVEANDDDDYDNSTPPIFIGSGELSIFDSELSGNTANQFGGGLFLNDGKHVSALTISGTAIYNNNATTYGNDIFIYNKFANINFDTKGVIGKTFNVGSARDGNPIIGYYKDTNPRRNLGNTQYEGINKNSIYGFIAAPRSIEITYNDGLSGEVFSETTSSLFIPNQFPNFPQRPGYILKERNTKIDGTGTGYNNILTGEDLAKDQITSIKLYAIWSSPKTVTITSNNTDYGTVNSGSVVVESGTDVNIVTNTITLGSTTITATPSPDTQEYIYSFSGFENNCGDTVTGDCSIIANFTRTGNTAPVLKTVTISSNNSEYGTTNNSSVSVPSGTPITVNGNIINIGTDIIATPAASTSQFTYSFSSWTNNCGDTLTNDCSVIANFTRTENGGGTAAGGGRIIKTEEKTETKLEHNATDNKKPQEQDKEKENNKEEYSPELTGYKTENIPIEDIDLWKRAYENSITTQNLEKSDAKGYVTRGHMAKMLVNFVVNVFGMQTPEHIPEECRRENSNDIRESDEILFYAKTACSMEIMGVNMQDFLPNDYVTKAQFGTIVSRILWGNTYNIIHTPASPFYTYHLIALEKHGFIEKTLNPNELLEIRNNIRTSLRNISSGNIQTKYNKKEKNSL